MNPETIETVLKLPEALHNFEEKYNVKTETISLHGKMLALKVYTTDKSLMLMYARRQGSTFLIFPSQMDNDMKRGFENLCQAVFNSNLWIGGVK